MRRILLSTSALLILSPWAANAIPIDTGLFTQNNLRQCSSETACIGGDPSIEIQSGLDLSSTGIVTTHINHPELGAESGTSIGYLGESFIPTISLYATTSGPQRFTLAAFGFQQYVFLQDGTLNIQGNMTLSQSGQSSPTAENLRGRISGASIMAFQFDDDIFETDDCNLANLAIFNVGASFTNCLRRNGETDFFGNPIEFLGLQNFQEMFFPIPGSDPVDNGSFDASLTINGLAGDVFYLAASAGIQAHLGGFADSRNTLTMAFDNPDLVQASFREETFRPAPIPEPGTLGLLGIGLAGMGLARRRKKK